MTQGGLGKLLRSFVKIVPLIKPTQNIAPPPNIVPSCFIVVWAGVEAYALCPVFWFYNLIPRTHAHTLISTTDYYTHHTTYTHTYTYATQTHIHTDRNIQYTANWKYVRTFTWIMKRFDIECNAKISAVILKTVIHKHIHNVNTIETRRWRHFFWNGRAFCTVQH